MIRKILKNKKGVTLLELTVAIAIFSVVILSATQIFKMVLEGQRNAIAAQNIQESMRYVLEVMSKEIRMAQKEDETIKNCPLITDDKVYEASGDGNAILAFKNYNGDCVKYYLDSGRFKIDRGSDSGYITPDEINITNLEFVVVDDGIVNEQSRVTIKMDVEAVGKEMHEQATKIQTTISSRYYE